MAEGASPTQEQEVRDLSAGSLPPSDERLQSKILEYHEQRRNQRSWLFYSIIAFCVVMTLAFLGFVGKILFIADSNGGIVPDWHLLLLGSGLILPPTVILFGLMRRVYATEESSRSRSDAQATPDTPTAELLTGVSEVLQKVVGMVATLSDRAGKNP